MRLAALVLLVGCRWHFDARDDGGTGPGPNGDGGGELVDSPFAPTTDAPPTAITQRWGECANTDFPGGTTDTSLDDTRPTENFGRRDTMRVGNNRVSLIRFNIPSPLAVEFFSASLEISVSTTDALEQGRVDISPMLESWDEGMEDFAPGWSNWTERQMGVAWSVAGAGAPGSRAPEVMGTFTPSLENVRHDVPLDIFIVAAWFAGGNNAGMALYGVNTGTQGAWLQTREATDATARPCLRVTYVP